MYAKLVNGNLSALKMPIKLNGIDIFTNDENMFIANGYKPVVFTEPLNETDVPHWVETETVITQVWDLIEEGVTE